MQTFINEEMNLWESFGISGSHDAILVNIEDDSIWQMNKQNTKKKDI